MSEPTVTTKTYARMRGNVMWTLELDRNEVNANDPGEGTPAMVWRKPVTQRRRFYGEGEASGTYWCALGEGVLSSDDSEIPDDIYRWLQEKQDAVNAFLYPDD